MFSGMVDNYTYTKKYGKRLLIGNLFNVVKFVAVKFVDIQSP